MNRSREGMGPYRRSSELRPSGYSDDDTGRISDDDATERATRAKRGSPFLNTDQAAAYLKITGKHLKRLRVQGEGPRYRRHARYVQYHIDDLDAWSVERSGPRDRG